ncbi:MAG: hypothetical protein ACREHG_02230 [Candidatus Saccharimonadales bacterium]
MVYTIVMSNNSPAEANRKKTWAKEHPEARKVQNHRAYERMKQDLALLRKIQSNAQLSDVYHPIREAITSLESTSFVRNNSAVASHLRKKRFRLIEVITILRDFQEFIVSEIGEPSQQVHTVPFSHNPLMRSMPAEIPDPEPLTAEEEEARLAKRREKIREMHHKQGYERQHLYRAFAMEEVDAALGTPGRPAVK